MRQVVTNKKSSFTRGSNCKALTVLWIGGCLWEVVAYDRWSHMEVRLYYILYSSVLSLSKIYCIYRPDQGLQPSHQEGSIHSPADDGLPPPSSQGWSRLSVKTCKEQSSTSAQPQTPSLSRADQTLEAVEKFTYVGSSNLSLDTERNKRVGKAAAVLARLGKRCWPSTPR